MSEVNVDEIRKRVEDALSRMPDNRFGLHLAEDGVHCIDGRWWVYLEADREPKHRFEMWEEIASVEEMLEGSDPSVSVTAA